MASKESKDDELVEIHVPIESIKVGDQIKPGMLVTYKGSGNNRVLPIMIQTCGEMTLLKFNTEDANHIYGESALVKRLVPKNMLPDLSAVKCNLPHAQVSRYGPRPRCYHCSEVSPSY